MKQSDIREEHLRNVYEYVLHHSRVSRAKIARELELSRPSSSSLVDELIFMGALYEDGEKEVDKGIGRNPILIKTDFHNLYCIVLFWKEKGISVSVVSMAQGLSVKERMAGSVFSEVANPSDYGIRTRKIIRRIKRSIEEKNRYPGSLIIFPGIVDSVNRTVFAPDLGINRETGRRILEDIKEGGEDLPGIFEESLIRGYIAMRAFHEEEENTLYLRLTDGISGAYFLKKEYPSKREGRAFSPGHFIFKEFYKKSNQKPSLYEKEERKDFFSLNTEIGEKALREDILTYFGKEKILLQFPEITELMGSGEDVEDREKENRESTSGKFFHFLQETKETEPAFYHFIKDKYLYYTSLVLVNCSVLFCSKKVALGGFFQLFGDDFKEELKLKIRQRADELDLEVPELYYYEALEEELPVASSDYFFTRYYHFTEGKIDSLPFWLPFF